MFFKVMYNLNGDDFYTDVDFILLTTYEKYRWFSIHRLSETTDEEHNATNESEISVSFSLVCLGIKRELPKVELSIVLNKRE